MDTNDEGKIQEGQIIPGTENDNVQKDATEKVEKPEDAFVGLDELEEEDVTKKNKSEFRSRLMLVFVLGFLIGIALKTEALKKITIGYNDYLMNVKPQSYDINGVQAKLQKERDTVAQEQELQAGATDSGSVDESEESAPVSGNEKSTQGATNDPAQN